MMDQPIRVALVLTGGGARTAYQVGVLEAFATMPVELVAISATGAGALNGALLAANPNTGQAAHELRQLWNQTFLSEEAALRLGPVPILGLGNYLTLLFAGGVRPQIEEHLQGAVTGARKMAGARRAARAAASGDDLVDMILGAVAHLTKITNDSNLYDYVSGKLQSAASNPQIPFYVSLYEVADSLIAKIKMGLQLSGILEVKPPQFIEISDPRLPDQERVKAVLAAATVPFVCEAGSANGTTFIDGSFAGMNRSTGAVPIAPLLRDGPIHADIFVVVHSDSGVTWDASDFPEATIVEIRPSESGERAEVGYFWSDKSALNRWIDLGRHDCEKVMRRWLATTSSWGNASAERAALIDEAKGLDD